MTRDGRGKGTPLADMGRQLRSSQHRGYVQNVSLSPLYLGYPKSPSFRQQGRSVKTAMNYGVKQMGNRCLTFTVTWREMFGHKGLKMRDREWM